MADALMSRPELAQLLGLTDKTLFGEMKKFETKLQGVRVNEGKVTITYYDRAEALQWADSWRRYKAVEQGARATPRRAQQPVAGQKAQPRTAPLFKNLTLPQELQTNFERASQVQPTLYTPNGYGGHGRSWGGSEGKL